MTALITKSGEHWEADPEDIAKWKQLYPAIDVDQEINAMAGWLDANPSKRKTQMKRFVNSWLNRANNRGGSPYSRPKPQTVATRDMSTLDDLTQILFHTDAERLYMLNLHGQYFENGKRFTQLGGE